MSHVLRRAMVLGLTMVGMLGCNAKSGSSSAAVRGPPSGDAAVARENAAPPSAGVLAQEGLFICSSQHKHSTIHRVLLWSGECYVIDDAWEDEKVGRLTLPLHVRESLAAQFSLRRFFGLQSRRRPGVEDGDSLDLRVASKQYAHRVYEYGLDKTVAETLNEDCRKAFAEERLVKATRTKIKELLAEIRRRADELGENDQRRVFLGQWLAERERSIE